MAIVADFESYPQWNEEVKGVLGACPLRRRPAQPVAPGRRRQGFDVTYIQAIYYPGENQIQTVMQQGDLFSKQEQLFSVVAMGTDELLTVDLDVETDAAGAEPMVKKMVNDALDHLAGQPEEARRRAGSPTSA